MLNFILSLLPYTVCFIFGFFIHALLSMGKNEPLERVDSDAMRRFEIDNLKLDIEQLEQQGNTAAVRMAKRLLETLKENYYNL